MTVQQALNRIKESLQYSYQEELEVAVNVLSREIPKEPKLIVEDKKIVAYECPRCEVKRKYFIPRNYCCECGQKLMWEFGDLYGSV